MIRRTRLVYGMLLAIWCVVVVWQTLEHDRVEKSAQSALLNRSRDITSTLALVIRSQRRFGVVSQERIESALTELVKSGELSSVALLNGTGEIVASAGTPIDLDATGTTQSGVRWEARSVTVVNLLDLGASLNQEGETNRPPTIVLPRRDTNAPPREDLRFPPRPRNESRTNDATALTNTIAGTNLSLAGTGSTNRIDRGGGQRRLPPGGFGRPFGMNEADYQSLLAKRGLHGLVIAMSTEPFTRATLQDLWMRSMIACFAAVAVAGLALAWRHVSKSSELEMRLLRASELNTHLREMNLAAAGLAHETKNPLNIIRGMAQIISKQGDASPEVRQKSRSIVDEADRVTAQVNEFINYSRPREVRRSVVALGAAVGEVVRALGYDLEEKSLRLQVPEGLPRIEADEQLFRQVLFNLLINAIQAADCSGDITIAATRLNPQEAVLEIRDNGPGVPLEQRKEIFKPYFTTHQKGTGLGLAVVQQIVLAHGWEIECLANEPRGAIFRITHLKLAEGG